MVVLGKDVGGNSGNDSRSNCRTWSVGSIGTLVGLGCDHVIELASSRKLYAPQGHNNIDGV